MSSYFNKEKAKKTIALVLDKLKTDADPQSLGEYQSLIKKEVSFFHRTKVAAYLLMLCDQGKSLRFIQERHASRAARDSKPFREEDIQRYPLAEEESRRLFFSAGRSRRVYPREILGLINTKTAIPKEDIGAIRILENYSFVQVRDTVADTIIKALNGMSFRGRLLTVNYAKSRKDEDDESYTLEKDQNHTEEEDI